MPSVKLPFIRVWEGRVGSRKVGWDGAGWGGIGWLFVWLFVLVCSRRPFRAVFSFVFEVELRESTKGRTAKTLWDAKAVLPSSLAPERF